MTAEANFIELDYIELNKSTHNRQDFDCGIEELNKFLQQFALRHRTAGISKTMVLAAKDDESEICCYYTLSHTEIERQSLPLSLAKKLPRYPIPVMLIAQLAVNKKINSCGLGKVTLVKALQHCYKINLHLPSYAVVVDALDKSVQSFYEQYGFIVLDTKQHRQRLFLPMKTVRQLFID